MPKPGQTPRSDDGDYDDDDLGSKDGESSPASPADDEPFSGCDILAVGGYIDPNNKTGKLWLFYF